MSYEIARKTIEEAIASGTTWLDLSDMGLTELPSSVWQLGGLTWLNLRRNKLTSLPEEIRELTSLTYINLSYNKINQDSPLIKELRGKGVNVVFASP